MHTTVIGEYDLRQYDFPAAVREILGGTDLRLLHEAYTADQTLEHDQNSKAHTIFYNAFDLARPIYKRFLRDRILPLFGQDLCVQAIPTLRLSFPGGTAVREFHRDCDYHHQDGTINFWLPLTEASGTNTLWLETAPGAADYQPVDLVPGQYLQFDAIRLRHGNVRNDTAVTRVSFDFRVIPRSRYRSTGLATVASAMPMELGSYYMLAEWGS